MSLFKKKMQPAVKKKIGFLSTIMFVIGSCVGAGIFFKARYILNNVHHDLVLSIFAWVIAAFAIIAMALVLVEVASTSLHSDKGIIEWNKIFNRKWIYYASKNFMTFLYIPITYFFMPVYACQSLIDALHAFGLDVTWIPWWSILIVSVIVNFWFIIVSGISSRAANIQSWMINMVKFVPMVIVVVIGFVILGLSHGSLPADIALPNEPKVTPEAYKMVSLSPTLGMFCSLSAVFFAYDGFYIASGIQSEMKEPKKTPLALIVGLLLVTTFYLLIAIASMVGSSSGTWDGFDQAFNSQVWKIFFGIFSLFIAFGVFGIMNSYTVWTPRLIESLILDDAFFKYFSRYKHKVNLLRPVLGIKISLIIALPVVIIFTIIGSLGYINVGEFSDVNQQVAALYSFSDLSSSWTAVLVFLFIAFAILGCLINRKTRRIKTKKVKFFIPLSIISLSIIFLSLGLEIVGPFYTLVVVLSHTNYRSDSTLLIGSILTVVVLFLYIAGMGIPTIFDLKFEKKLISKFCI